MNNPNETEVFAIKEKNAERLKPIVSHPYRSEFQRDRDRILYSKEFRRLGEKTQVFASGFDDNMRNRLTHTLEVAQIANTISTALGLNVYLTEAIALGHDVGHTPFGHVGERTLNYVMNNCYDLYGYTNALGVDDKGFKHNLQGVRVVSTLEKLNRDEPGLNLTTFTMWGIQNHTKSEYTKTCEFFNTNGNVCTYKNKYTPCNSGCLSLSFYDKALIYVDDNKEEVKRIVEDKRDWSFEGIVVAVADEIAQRHHDIEDGIHAGLITKEKLCDTIDTLFSSEKYLSKTDIDKFRNENSSNLYTMKISKMIVNLYVSKFIDEATDQLLELKKKFEISTEDDYWKKRNAIYNTHKGDLTNIIHLPDEFKKKDSAFQEFLSTHILQSELAQKMDGKASYIIRQLFKAFLTNPQQLPDSTIIKIAERMQIPLNNSSDSMPILLS